MPELSNGSRCLFITPVKDEERHLEATIRSVSQQSVRPWRWILVDDGSQDRTPEILRRHSECFDWIQVLTLRRVGDRHPGSAVIRAFTAGYETVAAQDFDFVVKLDGDVDLPADYLERLLAKFREDKALGIASGVYLENQNGRWLPVKMPDYHAAGASKMVRKKCFTDIGGFVPARGWDTLDEIRAQRMGWKSTHFEEIQFRHLKVEGAGIGRIRTSVMHGEICYLTGGGAGFFLLKFLHRLLFGKPFCVAGLVMLWGYLKPWISGTPRLATKAEARFYRCLLNTRVRNRLLQAFGKLRPNNETQAINY
jgi:biofilm PGA synthesis N-glycosyltransferase PgaC